jgi:hypothetical protein
MQRAFEDTANKIQAEIKNMKTKTEILAYLDQVGTFISAAKKQVRFYLKGMK